jgi:hypothetical protein
MTIGLGDGDGETEAEAEPLNDGDGETDGDSEADGDWLAEGEIDGLALADNEADGETEGEKLADAEADGDVDAEGETDGDGDGEGDVASVLIPFSSFSSRTFRVSVILHRYCRAQGCTRSHHRYPAQSVSFLHRTMPRQRFAGLADLERMDSGPAWCLVHRPGRSIAHQRTAACLIVEQDIPQQVRICQHKRALIWRRARFCV